MQIVARNLSLYTKRKRKYNMKKYIYLRVSSETQDYTQQKQCIDNYFARYGIDMTTVESITVEKHTGTDSHKNRKFAQLLETAQSGDIIYISELSRIGRNMADIFDIVNTACNKGRAEAEAIGRKTGITPPYGVTIFECKGNGTQIENNSVGGKAILFALSLAAELEVANIQQRTRMALEERKSRLKSDGHFVSKSGKVCTHLGREKGCDTSAATKVSNKVCRENAKKWRESSPGYKAVRRWVCEGMKDEFILKEFNELNKSHPDSYCTRRGKPLTHGMLKIWRAEIRHEAFSMS